MTVDGGKSGIKPAPVLKKIWIKSGVQVCMCFGEISGV